MNEIEQRRLVNVEQELGIKFGLKNESARLKDLEQAHKDLKDYTNAKLMDQWGEFRKLVDQLREDLEKQVKAQEPKKIKKIFRFFQ